MGAMDGPSSSLPLEILLYFNKWYNVVYFILMTVMLIYKIAIDLPYPHNGFIALEWCLLVLYGFIEYFRLFMGSKGNLTRRALPVVFFLILSAVAITANFY